MGGCQQRSNMVRIDGLGMRSGKFLLLELEEC